jgi:hypothetical protein
MFIIQSIEVYVTSFECEKAGQQFIDGKQSKKTFEVEFHAL